MTKVFYGKIIWSPKGWNSFTTMEYPQTGISGAINNSRKSTILKTGMAFCTPLNSNGVHQGKQRFLQFFQKLIRIIRFSWSYRIKWILSFNKPKRRHSIGLSSRATYYSTSAMLIWQLVPVERNDAVHHAAGRTGHLPAGLAPACRWGLASDLNTVASPLSVGTGTGGHRRSMTTSKHGTVPSITVFREYTATSSPALIRATV